MSFAAVFVRGKPASKYNFRLNILLRCIVFYRFKKTSWFGTESHKNRTIIISCVFFIDDLKNIVGTNITNHVANAISVQPHLD